MGRKKEWVWWVGRKKEWVEVVRKGRQNEGERERPQEGVCHFMSSSSLGD